MADPKTQLLSFPLAIGMDNVSFDEAVQPTGQSPALVESLNTRLTKLPGCVSKSPNASTISTGTAGKHRSFGIVPSGAAESSADFYTPYGDGNRVILPNGTRRLSGVTSQSSSQSSYRPIRVAFAESEALSPVFMTPAISYDSVNGWTFKAFIAKSATGTGANIASVFITVTDSSGGIIVPPVEVVSLSPSLPAVVSWFGLSAHGSGGVVLWYQVPATSVVYASRLSIGADYVLTAAAAAAIYTPLGGAGSSISLAYDTTDNQYAYLTTLGAALVSDVAYHRVNISTMAVATVVVASAASATSYLGITYVKSGATSYLAAGISRAAGSSRLSRLDPVTMATTWSTAGPAYHGAITIGIWHVASVATYLVATINDDGTLPAVVTADVSGVRFECLDWAAGSVAAIADYFALYWYRTCGQAVTHKAGADEMYPLFTCTPCYADNTSLVTSLAFVTDPSVEVFTPNYTTVAGSLVQTWNCVARFGVDSAALFRTTHNLPSSCTYVHGDQYVCAYLTQVLGYDSSFLGYQVRTIGLDLSPNQPRYALTSDGTAVIAGAMPAIWDGSAIVEMSPLRAPKIQVDTTGGGGAAISTGTYLFAAVVSWRDAQGQLHRSPPSNIATISGAGMQPIVYVTQQNSYRNGVDLAEFKVTIYTSVVDGVVLYAQTTLMVYSGVGLWSSAVVGQPTQGADTPALYSDESASLAVSSRCLGATRDLAVISDRIWAVDAERRARVYYTKPREAGIFPEFNSSEMFIDLPASAGELLAVSSYRDAPLFLTTAGIWSVSGEGPDAAMNPPLFSAAQQVSDVPCTSTSSVVSTPVGVLYRSNDRYALFAGQSTLFPGILAADSEASVTCVALFRNQQEVAFILDDGRVHVFNYQLNAWTIWGTDTTGVVDIAAAAQESLDGPVLLFSAAAVLRRRLDPDSVSTTAQIRLETGWIALGGPQDDNRVANVVLHAKYAGAHALAMTIATDYGAAQPVKSMSAANTLSAQINNARYDMWAEPKVQTARALKLTIVESGSAGEAFQPVNMTLEVLKIPGKLTQSLLKSARK